MFRKLVSYQKAFKNAVDIYQISKDFPDSERFGITDQIRRSSRSVCSSIAEAYRKRIYKKHFISKLSDADSENSETIVWLDFAKEYKLISEEQYQDLISRVEEVGKLLNYMINNPSEFGAK